MFKCPVHSQFSSPVQTYCPVCFTETGAQIALVEDKIIIHEVAKKEADANAIRQLTHMAQTIAAYISESDEEVLIKVLSKVNSTTRLKMKYLLDKVADQ